MYLLQCLNFIFFQFGFLYSVLGGFPGGSEVKVSACKAGDPGSIPGSGRSPGEGNGNPLQYACLENPKDGGAWQVTVLLGDFHYSIFQINSSFCIIHSPIHCLFIGFPSVSTVKNPLANAGDADLIPG